MATQNASNQKFTNQADGFVLGGGTAQRNLTITGADITLTGSGTNTHTFPAASDTLVGRNSTDTLTNKTLSSPTFSGAYSFGGTPTWPTFNQNTTGSAATLTTSRNFQTDLASTTAVGFNGSANNTHGVTGILGVANGGTGRNTATTAYGIIAAGTTATGVQQTISPGTSGQFLKSAGASALASFASIIATDISDSSSVGRSVLTATDATAARTAIGAGTGNGDVTLTGSQTLTNKTLTSPVINGTVTGTAVATAATANLLAKWDANKNLFADNFIATFTTTATAAGTTVLTVASTQIQVFTGTSTQTVTLPTTSVVAGTQYRIINNSTGAVTVQSSGANTITILAGGSSGLFTALVATPTTAAHWDPQYWGSFIASGKALNVSNTLTLAGTDGTTMTFPGTSGNVVTEAATQTLSGKTLSSPTFSGAYSFGGTPTWPTFNQNTTGSAATLTTSRNFQTDLASTSAVGFNGSANNTHGVTGILAVANGGTGRNTATTAYGLIAAGTTATGAQQTISPGTSGQFLKSAGASSLASFASIIATDISDSTSVGRSVLTAVDATAARTAIGAGTGSGDVTLNGSQTLTNKTLTSPVINGTVSGTGVSTSPTASTLALRDSNSNLSASLLLLGFTSIATAAGTTTLTMLDNQVQVFTGTSTQTVVLPTTSVVAGTQFRIVNNSTGAVTVQSSALNTIVILAGNTSALVTALQATPTTAAHWEYQYWGTNVASGKAASISNSLTFAGTDGTTMTFPSVTDTVVGRASTDTLTNKTLTAPVLSGTVTGTYSFGGTPTWPTFNQNTTGSAATLTTSRNFQTDLASTTAVGFNGSANNTHGVTGTLAVTNGGTGRATSTTAYGIIAAGTTATGVQQTISPGTSGQFLKSAGASALASFASIVATDVSDSTSVGRSVLTATDATAARTAIGAGTGNGDVTLAGSQTLTNKTLTSPVINGTVSGTAVSTSPTASTLALRDSNSNLSASLLLLGFTSTATAAGTTTLTMLDNQVQVFTGTSTQTVVLPTTSVVAGTQFRIINNSTGAVTVQSSALNTIVILAGNTSGLFTALQAAPTANTHWDGQYWGTAVSSGKTLGVSNTLTLAGTDGTTMTFPGTSGNVVTEAATQTLSSKTLSSPTFSGAYSFGGTPTWPTFNQNTTGSAATLTTTRTLTTNLASTVAANFNGSANASIGVTGTLPVANGGTGAATLTGLVKGNGTSAFTAATAGTDYVTPTGSETLSNKTLASPTFSGAYSFGGTPTWPTFNQNTTGSAATLTTSRTFQTNLSSTSSVSFNGSANVTPGVTGTLAVGNGGTGATTLTGLVKGNGTSAFSAALAGTDYVTPTGSETLSNKTLTNPTVNNYTEGVVAIGTVTTSSTLNLTSGTIQTATLTASTACTFTMPAVGAGKSFVLMLKQAAATGNGSATFTGVKWNGMGAPTITSTAGKMDILSFFSDGTNWYGSYTQGYTP